MYLSEVCDVDVVIFDNTQSELSDSICEGLNVYKLNTRDNIYVNLKVLIYLLIYMYKYGRRGYWYAVMRTINPKVVVTTIDNNQTFWWLDKNYRYAKFLAVENSSKIFTDRPNSIPYELKIGMYYKPNKIPYHSNLACMGVFDKENYMNNSQTKNIHIVGSLKNSLYLEKTFVIDNKYDICLISDSIIDYYSYTPILLNLQRFISNNPAIKIVVAMKKGIENCDYLNHKKLFIKYLGEDVTVVSRSDLYSTYRLSDQAELTISSFSTTLRESFSRKNKILSCNYTGFHELSHNFPDDLLVENDDYDEFECKVLYALNTSNEEYFEKHGHLIPYYNNYNKDKPTHIAINELIKNLMKE